MSIYWFQKCLFSVTEEGPIDLLRFIRWFQFRVDFPSMTEMVWNGFCSLIIGGKKVHEEIGWTFLYELIEFWMISDDPRWQIFTQCLLRSYFLFVLLKKIIQRQAISRMLPPQDWFMLLYPVVSSGSFVHLSLHGLWSLEMKPLRSPEYESFKWPMFWCGSIRESKKFWPAVYQV